MSNEGEKNRSTRWGSGERKLEGGRKKRGASQKREGLTVMPIWSCRSWKGKFRRFVKQAKHWGRHIKERKGGKEEPMEGA